MKIPGALELGVDCLRTFAAPRRTPEQIRRIRFDRLRRLLTVAGTTDFWGRRFRDAGVESPGSLTGDALLAAFRGLQPVSKAELREAGTAALNGGRVAPNWHTSRSSGATGEPFRTYFDRRSWILLKHVVKLRARMACGVRPHHRLALVDAFDPREHGNGPLARAGRVHAITALQPAADVAHRLASFDPDIVYGLPTALLEAARAARESGISVTSPNRLFTSGELLSPAVRSGLERAYRCRVFDVYGTTETKEIAWECVAGSMHVNSDVVMLEVLDDTGSPSAAGEQGRIAATVLVNTAMPLLRYFTGDVGSLLPGSCTCGCSLPRFGVVTGREVDVLRVDGRRVAPYAITCAMEEVAGIRRYQVVQSANESVRTRAELDGTLNSDAVEASIYRALEKPLGEARITVEFVDGFPSEGKFHVVRGPGRVADGQSDA